MKTPSDFQRGFEEGKKQALREIDNLIVGGEMDYHWDGKKIIKDNLIIKRKDFEELKEKIKNLKC